LAESTGAENPAILSARCDVKARARIQLEEERLKWFKERSNRRLGNRD
jgi:hypothetical protein